MTTTRRQGEWFIVPSGSYEGRPHLRGWMHSAIKGEATGERDDGWLAYAICPLCFAMVQADDGHAYGDLIWAHEQWHARTDFPIPDEIGRP